MTPSISIIYFHKLIADSFKYLIEKETKINIVGFFEYKSLVKLPCHKKNDIFIFEISYLNSHIIDTIRKIKSTGSKVMIVGLMINNGLIEEILNLDIDAYVLKTCSNLNLLFSIEQVINGHKYFCSSITEELNNKLQGKVVCSCDELTVREKDVLKGLVNLLTTTQIAELLNITVATVRTHRKNIMSKYGAKNYIGLLRRACSEGLLSDGDENFCSGCIKQRCNSPLFE